MPRTKKATKKAEVVAEVVAPVDMVNVVDAKGMVIKTFSREKDGPAFERSAQDFATMMKATVV